MFIRRVALLFAGMMALAVVLAACGQAEPTATPAPTATIAGPSTPPPGGATATPAPSPTPDLAAHFRGKNVTMVVATAPAGGFDTAARLAAQRLPSFLPGSPRIVVQNLSGAGQLRGHQTAYMARPDGLTVGMLHPRWVTNQWTGAAVENWDANRIRVLGTATAGSDSNLFCINRNLATSWDEVRALGRTIIAGEPGPGNPGVDILALAGEPFRSVYGYGGSAEVLAAFDRGELDMTSGYCTPAYVERLYPEWVTEGRIFPLFWNRTPPPPEDWMRTLDAPYPPYVLEIPGLQLTDEQRAVYQVYESVSLVTRAFFLPPDTPDDITDAWEDAIRSVSEDPEFIERMINAGYTVKFGYAGDDFKQILDLGNGLSPSGRAILQELLGE